MSELCCPEACVLLPDRWGFWTDPRVNLIVTHCPFCKRKLPRSDQRADRGLSQIEKKKAFTGIPRISAKLEGDTLHIRNDGDAPALVRGAVFGYLDDAGNFVAEEYTIHSIAIGNGRAGASTCTRCGNPFYSDDVEQTVCGGCRGLGGTVGR